MISVKFSILVSPAKEKVNTFEINLNINEPLDSKAQQPYRQRKKVEEPQSAKSLFRSESVASAYIHTKHSYANQGGDHKTHHI